MHSSLSCLFLLVELGSALRTFQPNCTLPSEVVDLVYAPGVRGTFNILWSSIFTVFICTWTVQHLNIPEQIPQCPKFWGRVMLCLKRLYMKLNWMILFVIIPEFLVGQALQDYMMAWNSHRKMLRILREKIPGRYGDGKWWTMTHAFYANMGGFVLRRRIESSNGTTKDPHEEFEHIDAEEMVQVLDRVIDNLRSEQDIQDKATGKKDDLVTTDHIETIDGHNKDHKRPIKALDSYIDSLPSEQEIQDKSKGDMFIKGTAVVQVLWLLVQVTVRHSQGLPTSQLEITVLAFAVCAFITYILFWEKPQGVMTPTYITAVDIPPRDNPPPGFPDPDMLTRTKWFQSTFLLRKSRHPLDRSRPIPNDIEYVFLRKTDPFSYIDIGAAICGTISGGLHCLAWNYPFPTLAEKDIWRAAAFFITVCPGLFLLAVQCAWTLGVPRWIRILERQEENYSPREYRKVEIGYPIVLTIAVVTNITYSAARLYIVVESLRALLFLPPESFMATSWSAQFPHVS